MSKVNLQEVIFTPADAAEALETIAWLERDERGSIPARLMYDDPHKPPVWWHVRHMLNLTLLARTVAAQEGTAPAPGNPKQMSFVEDPVNNGAALLRLKAKLKEGKYALNWTRLSCRRFVSNRVRLALFVLAYNLGNFLRRLCLPRAIRHWSLRSVQVKLIKIGGRLVRHARRLIFQLSEVSVPESLFRGVLDRIGRLSPAPS